MTNYKLYKGAWRYEKEPHNEQKLEISECKALLSRGGLMIRNVYDFDYKEKTSFWYVIKDSFGGIDELPTKVRNQVRKSLKTFDIKIISPEYLAENGYEIYVKAAERYKVKFETPSIELFKNRILSGDSSYDYWGCIDKETGHLAAFSINHIIGDFCDYQTMKANSDFLKNYPFYGLLFQMNQYYLQELRLRYVSDGTRSITNHSNIQPFLIEKFKFRNAYCHLQIVYKWWIRIAVNILYPFRNLIPIHSIRSILNMEAMNRGKL